MDNRTFNTRLSRTLERDAEETATIPEALGRLLAETGADLDSVAIPGFGTFTTVKTDESIVTDAASGERTLLPPSIRMYFQPSVVLRKKLSR